MYHVLFMELTFSHNIDGLKRSYIIFYLGEFKYCNRGGWQYIIWNNICNIYNNISRYCFIFHFLCMSLDCYDPHKKITSKKHIYFICRYLQKSILYPNSYKISLPLKMKIWELIFWFYWNLLLNTNFIKILRASFHAI